MIHQNIKKVKRFRRTFNIPNLIEKVPLRTSSGILGHTDGGSVPNITGGFGYNLISEGTVGPHITSAIYTSGEYSTGGSGSAFKGRQCMFDASRSSNTYRRTDGKVIPAFCDMYYCIKY